MTKPGGIYLDRKIDISTSPRRILLLQGPVGPFFRILAQDLRQHGFEVDHVTFNLGDLFFSGFRDVVVFRKSDDAWRAWMETALREQKYQAIVLFGCQRDRHEIARELANEYDVPLLSLEEGYIRPGYITAEPGGNNNYSSLARLPVATYNKNPARSRLKRTKGRAYRTMVALGAGYYIARAFGYMLFRRVEHHKQRCAVPESLRWIRNIYRKKTRYNHNRSIISRLTQQHAGKYFIVPLQVHDDLQLLKFGRGWNNDNLIKTSIASFAKHAAKDHVLVIKSHPMDRGHTPADKLVRQTAAEHGCSDRVYFLDDGVMGSLTRSSRGMVTINSTSGLSALLHGVPLATFGDAMYAYPELVNRIDTECQMDEFWQNGKVPPKKLAVGFRKHMVVRALLPGDFYHKEDRQTASKNVSRRLLRLLATGQ